MLYRTIWGRFACYIRRYLNHNALLVLALDFNLTRLDFRLARSVSLYEASVAAAIDMIFLTEVVFVKESDAERCNADKKSF